MNRLILIGNGFDLAHGMKTSFKDFIAHYIAKTLNNASKAGDQKQRFFTTRRHIPQNIPIENALSIFEQLKTQREIISISLFFNSITTDIKNKNWVDIESVYFSFLSAHLTNKTFIKALNLELDYLKTSLIEYLTEEENKINSIYGQGNKLANCFIEEIYKDEIVTTRLNKDKKPDFYHILNFNYTNTAERYKDILINKGIHKDQIDVNYIHGSLDSTNGEPIFGFGDELDKKFKTFEELNNNDLFKHIKSFGYLQNKNYYNLIRFIDGFGDFQVQIYGHSCGLTDRTLLNKIFEHEGCKSIKIFYYEKEGENDFTERTHEIYRHFENKDVLREKIVHFKLSKPMPQDMEVDRTQSF
ncbi:MAG: hypothetical protein HRT69_17010 [Flavobacteriaceae bacterium]|nr:hypothetical protein [Flavobacteriaceae bacterium]